MSNAGARLECIQWKDSATKGPDGKPKRFAVKLGGGVEKDGEITVWLDALPLPDKDGVVKITVKQQRRDPF